MTQERWRKDPKGSDAKHGSFHKKVLWGISGVGIIRENASGGETEEERQGDSVQGTGRLAINSRIEFYSMLHTKRLEGIAKLARRLVLWL